MLETNTTGDTIKENLSRQLNNDASGLTQNQNKSLHVLGYLFLRMGLWDKAEHTFNTLIALRPKGNPCSLSHAALAAIFLEKKDGENAMQHLHIAMKDLAISSKNATFHLMKAKALWLEERHDEAKLAIDEYLYIMGNKDNNK